MASHLPQARARVTCVVLALTVLAACHDDPTDTNPDLSGSTTATLASTAPSPLTGDFDGEGHTDIALYDSDHARALLDATVDGQFDGITPALGLSTDIPFMGDWNDDGVQTLALFRSPNQVIYCNTSNKTGQFLVRTVDSVGAQGGIPIRGDWNGDGRDGFAIYDIAARKFTFYQAMGAASKFATHTVGLSGDKPISGDWNNDGNDGYGVYRPSNRRFYYINTIGGALSAGSNDVGNFNDLPIYGTWPGHTNASVGLYRPTTKEFFLFADTTVAAYQRVPWTDSTSVFSTSGRQLFYTNGAPHTNGAAAIRTTFDSTKSFLPLGIYGIANLATESGGNIFQQLKAANFTAAMIWPTIGNASAISSVGSTGIKLIPRIVNFTTGDDGNSKVMAWYMDQDEPKAADSAALHQAYNLRQPQATRPLFHVNLPPNFASGGCPLGETNQNLWSILASWGDASVMDCYPVFSTSTLNSVESVAFAVSQHRTLAPTGRPLWPILEAMGNHDDPGTPAWAFPTPTQYRAMAYTAFVHGATGLIAFTRDGGLSRQVGLVGISPAPATVPSDCPTMPHDPECDHPISNSNKTKSIDLWNSIVGLNGEFTTLKPALLSPTKNDAYTVDVLQPPSFASSPIRTLLKSSPTSTYLIAVNITNQPLDAVVQLTASPTSASVQFESRNVSMPLSMVRDHFAPFAVHVYRY